MADIFVSYTSSDREWAFWIAHELEKLGHTPRVHDWEIGAGGDIASWMEHRHDKADNVLLVVSEVYLSKTYSRWERLAAQWAAAGERPNFALPVLIESCKLPTLLAQFKRCELFGLVEEETRTRLADYPQVRGTTAGIDALSGRGEVGGHDARARRGGAIPWRPQAAQPAARVARRSLQRAREGVGRVACGACGWQGRSGRRTGAARARRRRQDAARHRVRMGARGRVFGPPIRARREPCGLNANLATLAGASVLDLPEKEAREDEAKIEAVLRWLGANPTWLMILDNVDDPEAVKSVVELMPRLKGGHVIVTARAANFPATIRKLELDTLDEEPATQFLLERTVDDRQRAKDDEAQARTLAHELGGLALGLEQAGAHIATDHIGFARYLKLWNENREKALGWSDPTLTGSEMTMATTWATSVARLSPESRRLLDRLAMLAPDPIPDSLLDVRFPVRRRTMMPRRRAPGCSPIR